VNILHVTPYYAPAYSFGGVVRAVEGMARALAGLGHNVTVLTTDAHTRSSRSPAPREEMRDGVRVIRLPNRSTRLRGTLNLSTPAGLSAKAASLLQEADIVHLHEFRTIEALRVVPLSAAARVPVVLSAHGTLTQTTGRGSMKRLWDRLYSARLGRGISGIIALTQAERADAAVLWRTLGLAPPRQYVIPNGIRLADFDQPAHGLAFREKHGLGSRRMCLFMGRLHPRKGVVQLAEAFREAALTDAALVIAGPDEGALAEVQRIAARAANIHIAGYLDGQDRLDALDAADLFALPATGEGFSMALLEAAAMALPLLISPGCHFPEAVEAGAAVSVEPEVPALKDALRALLSDDPARLVMAAKARKLAEHYDWPALAVRLQSVYRHFI
jgi:glycosyltransferase involved in cell wall biosynthesis